MRLTAPTRGDIRYHGQRHAPSGRAPPSPDHPVSTAYNVPGQRNGGQSAPPREQTQYRAPPRARITCRVPRRLHRGDHTGFTTDFLVDLIRAGLATAQTERAHPRHAKWHNGRLHDPPPPLASTSKSSSLHSPDGRLAEAHLRIRAIEAPRALVVRRL